MGWAVKLSVSDIKESAENKNLIIIFGAGASIALTSKSRKAKTWKSLVESSLSYAHQRGLIETTQLDRMLPLLASNDIDELLGVAEFAGKKLSSPNGTNYSNWMRDEFIGMKPDDDGMINALRSVQARGIPLATLNYDTLVETATGLMPLDIESPDNALSWARRETAGVFHIHGVWNKPSSCIYGIRDYDRTKGDEFRSFLQKSLLTLNRILFIGCGDTFSDPNFSTLVEWLKTHAKTGMPRHYALVRKSEYEERLKDQSWRGFVEPLPYGESYAELPGFILNCFPTTNSPSEPERKSLAEAGQISHTLDSYRNYLLNECGEMTLEGVRADLDTAQRKFNLEKLFVPIDVEATPPFFARSDPERESKLLKWKEKHGAPQAFGKVFSAKKRIALLALPGGGKTMLLKRLAVAYSSSSRRIESGDNLPNLDLIPVTIKCREWKDHIRKPIAGIIKSISDISADASLENLFSALEPRLKEGKVLLLIDGLDEIHDNGDRLVFVEHLERFIQSYPDIRLVVTSREAGFDLVAPTLARFCEKYRIAPLNDSAVTLLCAHWHGLMSALPSEAAAEASDVTEKLLGTASLRKLADNPLLLTMLLVVKHGAGKLPPDRVSLYDRAVETLLDTWNIKGHAALNRKEAVPQLSCLAFELLRSGKQTATEKEIVSIITDARERLPRIGRYANDAPEEFLRRVELRSSLLVEGGHQLEGGKPVPFYQFRHLTFQEYLAAEAIVNNNVISLPESKDVVEGIGRDFLQDQWKEVVPMVAVLLKHRARPLIEMLLSSISGSPLLENISEEEDRAVSERASAVTRLIQSMIEEAEFPTDLVGRSADFITDYLRESVFVEPAIISLGRSVYGGDLRSSAWNYWKDSLELISMSALRVSALLNASQHEKSYWQSKQSEDELSAQLLSDDLELRIHATLALGGAFWLYRSSIYQSKSRNTLSLLEEGISSENIRLQLASAWVWGFWRHTSVSDKRRKLPPAPSDNTLNKLASGMLSELDRKCGSFSAAITTLRGVSRNSANIILSDEQWEIISDAMKGKGSLAERSIHALRISFIAKGKFSDQDLKKKILDMQASIQHLRENDDIIKYFGLDVSDLNSSKKKRSTES